MDTLVAEVTKVTGSKQAAVSMIPVIPLVTVVMAKVKFSLCAYNGNTDCSVNG